MPLGSPATKRPLERDCDGHMLFKSDRASVEKYSCSTVGSTARRLPSKKTARTGIRQSRWCRANGFAVTHFAQQQILEADVCMGSKAEVMQFNRDVRSSLQSRRCRRS